MADDLLISTGGDPAVAMAAIRAREAAEAAAAQAGTVAGQVGAIAGANAGLAAVQPVLTQTQAARDTAAAAAAAAASAVAGAAIQATTYAALSLIGGSAVGVVAEVYADPAAPATANLDGSNRNGRYRWDGAAWGYDGPSVGALAQRVTAVPARRATGLGAGVLALFVDRVGRGYAGIDNSGRRWWAAGGQWLRLASGNLRWQRRDSTGPRLDLTADGVETDGSRVGLGGHTVRAVPQVAVGGFLDWLRVTDRAGRGIIRAGLGHVIAGKLRLIAGVDGSTSISGGRGVVLQQGATGGPTLPGRLTEGSYPGAHLLIRWLSGRFSAFRIDPADGALRLVGRSIAVDTGDFTAAELAGYAAEAQAYSEGVIRRRVALHQPTEQLVLWISYGQSLSTGWECWPALSRTPPPDCYMMGLSVHSAAPEGGTVWSPVGGSTALTPLVATVRDGSTGLLSDAQVAALAPGAGNRGETPLEGFASQFRAAWLRSRGKATGDGDNRWAFAACGTGGRSVAQLSVGAAPELFQRIRDAIVAAKAIATANGWSFAVGGVLYNQGEQDYTNGTTYADYLAGVTTLIGDIRSYVTAQTGQTGVLPVYMAQTGGAYAIDTQELAVARAQREIARTVPGVYLVANNQVAPDKGGHLTSNGCRWLGGLYARAAERTLIHGEGWECTGPIRWVHRGKTALGLFHAPSGALSFARPWLQRAVSPVATATDRGIYAADGTGTLTITAVTVEQGRLIRVTFARTVSGALKMWVGRRTTINGSICIADSDTRPLASAYEYTAGSGQYADENIAELLGLTYPTRNVSLADVQQSSQV